MSIVDKCVDKLEPYVNGFFTSMMLEGESLKNGLHCDCHELIYEIYWCVFGFSFLAIIPFVLWMSHV
jgi:sister-chromatid-cohesion protein PDS5